MTTRRLPALTRRTVIGALLSVGGSAAFANVPDVSPRPLPRGTRPVAPIIRLPDSGALIAKAGLSGDAGVAVIDVETGEFLEGHRAAVPQPPASTLKTVTALYALDRLGPSHRFPTRVLTTGTMINGRLNGDLILAGGGDPTLDTDRLAELAVAIREAGLIEVKGRFLLWGGALPEIDRIDGNQPDQVGYNPAIGGLNLNFNRVHFEWERGSNGYQITMEARARRFSPSTSVAHMSLADRKSPVYEYRRYPSRDVWTVAKGALGKSGARWLPVRFPTLYAGDVFRTLARSNGIILGAAESIDALPEGALEMARIESGPLGDMLHGMLKYSTNLTAEAAGLSASQTLHGECETLTQSGTQMKEWAEARYGVGGYDFADHSGLGYGSEIAPAALATILARSGEISPLLKTVNLGLDKSRPAPTGVTTVAKTGTLNFVSALAGFVRTPKGRELAFAILTGDRERRDAIPPQERERPQGARGWASRSRHLQKELIRNWAARFDA